MAGEKRHYSSRREVAPPPQSRRGRGNDGTYLPPFDTREQFADSSQPAETTDLLQPQHRDEYGYQHHPSPLYPHSEVPASASFEQPPNVPTSASAYTRVLPSYDGFGRPILPDARPYAPPEQFGQPHLTYWTVKVQ